MKRRIFIFTFCCLLIVAITACSSVSEVIEIPNQDQFVALDIQGVNDEGAASSETKKVITDKDVINTFINKVDEIKVIESDEKVIEKSKELNEKGNYIIALSDNEELQKGNLYYINMFNDGTFTFSDTNGKEIKFISEETKPELVSEIKELLKINF